MQLLGKTRIGARCKIGTGSILQDVRVDDDATIGAHSILDSSRVGAHAQVGPFARLRPGADIRAGAHVGNFVEMKNTVVHEGAKATHLSYLGDASIGANRISARARSPAITTAWPSIETTIGSRVFIGSDTALVAPVRVGDGAYVAAGSVITENVPADALGDRARTPGQQARLGRKRRREMKRTANAKPSRPKPKRHRNAKRNVARGSPHDEARRACHTPAVAPRGKGKTVKR